MWAALEVGADGRARCWWGASPPEYAIYHDEEWGRPVGDDRLLFEKLCLEGFQAGLSWLTILRKRPAFRAAFAGFDIAAVAGFGEADVSRLLNDQGIVRHRGKIAAAIGNAGLALRLIEEQGSLAAYVWSYAPEVPEVAPSLRSISPESSDDEPRSETTRLVVCRADDRVCLHAVDGAGQRSPRRLLGTRRGRGRPGRLLVILPGTDRANTVLTRRNHREEHHDRHRTDRTRLPPRRNGGAG